MPPWTLYRLVLATVLVVAAVAMPAIGFGAAGWFAGREIYGLIEGDWSLPLSLVAAGACVSSAVRFIRSIGTSLWLDRWR